MATFTLTVGNDIFVAADPDNSFEGTSVALNSGDSLTGGSGMDALTLYGSGVLRVDQLAAFTGVEHQTASVETIVNPTGIFRRRSRTRACSS